MLGVLFYLNCCCARIVVRIAKRMVSFRSYVFVFPPCLFMMLRFTGNSRLINLINNNQGDVALALFGLVSRACGDDAMAAVCRIPGLLSPNVLALVSLCCFSISQS